MSIILVEILVIFILVIINGILAMSEIAVVSARRHRLQQWAEAGNTRAKAALDLASEPNRFLSTVQIGITMVGILAGAYSGATLSEVMAERFNQIPAIAPYGEAVALGIVVLAITYLSLVVGELVPKRIGLSAPESVATLIAPAMTTVSRIVSPVIRLLSFSTEGLLRLLRIKVINVPEVTEEEVKILIQQGAQTGVFDEAEQEMMERVLRLGDRPINSLMTPRTQLEWIDLEDPWEQNIEKIQQAPHAMFPVVEGSLDQVLGIVHVKDLLVQSLHGKSLDLTAALRKPVFVPENMPALKVLELFKATSNHIALITDEYGVLQGLVTLTDILEGVVGDIPTLDELADAQVIRREDGSWLVDGMLSIDELKGLLDIHHLPGEEKGNFQTLGGFIITQLERIPGPTDHFEWENYRLEVVDMDGTRVDKVLVILRQEDQRQAQQ